MNKQRETGMVVIAGLVIMILVALTALFSCTTKERVLTEYITVHDTIHSHHTDTIRDMRVVTHTDTVRQVEWHNITLSQGGDTIKEIHHYYDTQKTIVVDSTDRYKAVVDSLKAALIKEKEKNKEIVKTKVPWKGIIQWCIFAVIIVGACIAVLKSKTK